MGLRSIRTSAVLGLLWLLSGAPQVGCTAGRPPGPVTDDPSVLPVDGPVVLRVHAQGVQIYGCEADASGRLAWKLKAPEATFSSGHGIEGRHYAGPTWECTNDGSKVSARKVGERPAPVPDAVPWLLLRAEAHQGSGLLARVTYVRRINTTGGRAPAVEGAKAGDEVRIPYTADYVFYGPGATTRE